MKVLIIEDESPAARRLIRLLEIYDPSMTIVGVLDSVEDAIEWFLNNKMPELVFLDIYLADGYSFEIFKHVDIKAPIIFTTAYDNYALKAFEVNSVDYLLKPIDDKKLEHGLNKLDRLSPKSNTVTVDEVASLIKTFRNKVDFKSRFLIRQKSRLLTIKDVQIAYFFASNKLVMLVTYENRHFPMDETLESYEKQVDPNRFFRLNRSYLVNREAIKNIYTHFHGKLKIELEPVVKEEIYVSRDRAPVFKEWLER